MIYTLRFLIYKVKISLPPQHSPPPPTDHTTKITTSFPSSASICVSVEVCKSEQTRGFLSTALTTSERKRASRASRNSVINRRQLSTTVALSKRNPDSGDVYSFIYMITVQDFFLHHLKIFTLFPRKESSKTRQRVVTMAQPPYLTRSDQNNH